jgi:hypothetical protein
MSTRATNARPSTANAAPTMRDSDTFGTPELCAWQVAPSVFWIQTTEPRFSRKLDKREDVHRVEVRGVNHFRRIFEIRGRRRKIQRIIDRYLLSACDQFSSRILPPARRKLSRVSTQRGDHK